MAKYSKAASKKVEQSVKEMKKGTLKTGTGKKVTDKKQAVAIGLSEARREGKKAPKKAVASTKKTTSKKSTAPVKKAAVKKSALPAKKAAPKKAAAKKAATTTKKATPIKSAAPAKKAAAKKSTTKSTKSAAPKKAVAKKVAAPVKKSAPVKSSPAAKKTATKKSSTTPKPASKAPVKKEDSKKTPTNIYNEPEVQDPAIQKNDVPVEEKNSDPAMQAFEEPNPIPRKKYAVAKDTYHNHLPPTAAKTSKKPSGKKPLWNSGN